MSIPSKQRATGGDRRLFLVDGSALAYRSHFAFIRTPLSNGKGLNTGAIYGYTRTLLKILKAEHPTHLAVIFDHPSPTFRHELFTEYKATRQKMPDEMREQLPWMKQVTETLGLPLLEYPGYEADDVIGTLAVRAAAEGFRVDIVTGDKDFMQLVSDRIRLYNIMKPEADVTIVDEAAVRAKFGVGPAQVVDVLALMGDSSDNVPGVKGIGEKTAIDLISTFGSLAELLARTDEVKRKAAREKLEAERDRALLSQDLVTIRVDVPIDEDPAGLARRDLDRGRISALFRELKFDSLVAEYAPENEDEPDREYRIVTTAAQLRDLIRELQSLDRVVVDLETTGLDALETRIVGLAFAHERARATYVPLNADPPLVPDLPNGCPGSGVLAALEPILAAASPEKCGQNIKYDMGVLLNHAIELRGVAFDTMLASYVLDPGERAHDLDHLALKHFDYKKTPTTDVIGKGRDQLTMDLVPIETVGEYAAEDADFTWRLWRLFDERLGDGDLRRVLDEIEMPLVPVLMRMERTGIRLETAVLSELEGEISADLKRIEASIYELAGREFTIHSPKQLSEILFEELAIHESVGVKPRKTKTGFSTDQTVLEALAAHPLPARILEYRSLSKLASTYVSALPKLVHPRTGRLHSNWNQAVAATGRLSSSDPNLQNIPIRTPLGKRIREAFVASDDEHVLLSADYSQIELRIMAHAADDPTMIDAFKRGADIHTDTAARVFGVEPELVDPGMRARAKSINFGILYGMGPQRLSRETNMSVEEAKTFIERYFETFPTVRAYIDSCHQQARDEGYVATLHGRRRPLPDILSRNGRLRAAAENMAVNTPIQGTAADLIKMAMIRIDAWLREEGLAGRMLLQVHDELVFDVPRRELDRFRERVRGIMTDVGQLKVPLEVETGVGANWSEAH